jgi:hypothetical protein
VTGRTRYARPDTRRSRAGPELLEPIRVADHFGDEPDIDEVDAQVRGVMQSALDRLARQRRFPVSG